MRKPLPILALLALAAASSAQTVVLSPVALAGYDNTSYGLSNYYSLRDGLDTYSRFKFVPRGTTFSDRSGWRAEFELPTVPDGVVPIMATFETHVISASDVNSPGFDQNVAVGIYYATGTIAARAPVTNNIRTYGAAQVGTKASIDLMSYLANDPYVGIDVEGGLGGGGPLLANVLLSTNTLTWSAPTLTLTYAPVPVPEPAPLIALGVGALALLRSRRG